MYIISASQVSVLYTLRYILSSPDFASVYMTFLEISGHLIKLHLINRVKTI